MIWAIVAAAAAASTPTYLRCTVMQGAEMLTVEVVADEPSQKAIVSLPTGRVVTRQAIFTPTEVKIPDQTVMWVVNRVDLGMKRILTIGDHRSEYSGKCEVTPAPAKRAF